MTGDVRATSSPEHVCNSCKNTSNNCTQLAMDKIYQWCCRCTARDDECKGCKEMNKDV